MTNATVEPAGLAPSSQTTPPVRRRRGWVFAAAGAVVIALMVTLIVIVTRPHPFTASDARRVGLTVMVGDTVFLPNGTTTTLGVRADAISDLAAIPGAYLAAVDEPFADTDLVIIYPGGSGGDIAKSIDSNFEVSADGRIAVVRSVDAENNIALRSIDIETSAQLHTYGDGNQHVIAVRGDWALISDDGDGSSSPPSVVWNIRTGAVVPFASSVGVVAWGVTPDGEVLRSIDAEHAPPLSPTSTSTRACYDLVAPDHTAKPAVIPTNPTGYCGRLDVTDATMSPDGSWVVLIPTNQSPGHGVVAVRTADLHDGRWAPVNLDQADGMSRPLFWDSPTSFIAPYTNDAGDAGYERCSVDGWCHDLGIPEAAVIVRSLGG